MPNAWSWRVARSERVSFSAATEAGTNARVSASIANVRAIFMPWSFFSGTELVRENGLGQTGLQIVDAKMRIEGGSYSLHRSSHVRRSEKKMKMKKKTKMKMKTS
jgi:hypothetical protein